MSGGVGSQFAGLSTERAVSEDPAEVAACVTVVVGGLVEGLESEDDWGSEPPHPASTAGRTNKSVASTYLNRIPLRPPIIPPSRRCGGRRRPRGRRRRRGRTR